MSDILQNLKIASRDHFASAMFLSVVGIIAIAFIGYLIADYTRNAIINRRIKRRHRLERQERREREQHGGV